MARSGSSAGFFNKDQQVSYLFHTRTQLLAVGFWHPRSMRADPELLSQAKPQDYHLHYGLGHAPFSIESDTSLFVLSSGHEQALDKLYRALLGRKSFLLITGAPGTGKTLLLQTLMTLAAEHCEFLVIHPEDVQPTDPNAAQLSELALAAAQKNQQKTGKNLIQGDLTLEVAPANSDKNAKFRDYVRKARSDRRHPTIVVDEAQRLSNTALETLRCWSNLDSQEGRAVQFILVGQRSLSARLNTPSLANLKQRIDMRCELPALSLAATQRYITHRCLLAGADQPIFGQAVIIRIYSLSRGYPRLINNIADALLLEAYLRGGRTITMADVVRVSQELDLSYAPIVPRPKP